MAWRSVPSTRSAACPEHGIDSANSAKHGLADEVLLTVNPVLLGPAKRLFAEGTSARSFELVSTQAFPSGIIFTTYKVAGSLKTG